MNINIFLLEKIKEILVTANILDCNKIQVKQTAKSKFGDYQVNGVISIAKDTNFSFQYLARMIANKLKLNNFIYKIEIINSGFINIFLSQKWLELQINKMFSSKDLNFDKIKSKIVVVDYSSPNIAKDMHVGHLRSTIIGDAMVRILSFLGHNVIRANHLGDWGTQFGMLIAYLLKYKFVNENNLIFDNLNKYYCEAKKKYDEDLKFAEISREYVVKLQYGDKYCNKLWRKITSLTTSQNQSIYEKLNVTLTYNDNMGESAYNHMLPKIVQDLKNKGIAIEKKGAIVISLSEFKSKTNENAEIVIRKKDGAYLYTTTDIACIKYRYQNLKANRILYYIDSRQSRHLKIVWTIAYKAGYISKSIPLEHHILGMVTDKYGKPLKTREGKVIKLKELINAALKRAHSLVLNRNPNIDIFELKSIVNDIGIGALKYADLSKNRNTDYIFNWDHMLNFEGNTAPYLQYAYIRALSVFKKSRKLEKDLINHIELTVEQEIKLALKLLQFEEILIKVSKDGTPHILCNYLYNLAVIFSLFYEKNQIINISNSIVSNSRIKLTLLTARVIKQGLNLLGINTVYIM